MWLCWSWSSAASSMVTMRSPSGMNEDMTLSSVVLPEPVPPLITMFSLDFTAPRSTSMIGRGTEPKATRSSGMMGTTPKRRMETTGPSRASGGMMALKRLPSVRRASHIGFVSSMRRPTALMMRSMTCIKWWSSLKRTSTRCRRPFFST